MIKIREKTEKRYRTAEVGKALGISDHAVQGYFGNRKISVKNGVTIEQIYECCKGNRRGDIRWNDVQEIRQILFDRYGVEIIEANEESQ